MKIDGILEIYEDFNVLYKFIYRFWNFKIYIFDIDLFVISNPPFTLQKMYEKCLKLIGRTWNS